MPIHATTASTELDAINTMLSVIGEAPINSLFKDGERGGGELPLDVASARNTLRETVREIQLEDWHFNTETDYPLRRNSNDEIHLPPQVFRVTLYDPDSRDVVLQGNRLYDRANHTLTFTEDITATITRFLTFSDMPEAFRWYATVRAARKFQDRAVGSPELHAFTAEDEAHARILAVEEDIKIARPSLAKGEATTFISGWTVGRTLRR